MTTQSDNSEIRRALEALKSSDRNVRVRALHTLATMPGDESAEGILLGLRDSKRRVRHTAVKLSSAYTFCAKIVERLKELSEDSLEKPKIRRAALVSLINCSAPDLPSTPALDAVGALVKSAELRSAILLGLLQRDLSPGISKLLENFVRDGSKEEAVAATKALCGFRVVNLGSLSDDQSRTTVRQTCELAAGSVFYWVPR